MTLPKSPRTTVHFTTLSDRKFFIPTLVMITSAKETMRSDSVYHLHFFHNGLDNYQLDALRELESESFIISINRVENDRYASFESMGGGKFPPASLMRLDLALLLPELDKVLYLDGDVVVLKDLTELYQTDLGDNLIAGVRSVLEGKAYLRDFPGEVNINAGVMVLNLKQLREEGYCEKFYNARLNAPPHWRLQDQDVINYCCAHRIKPILPKYNGLAQAFQSMTKDNMDEFNALYGTSYKTYGELENDFVLMHLAGTHGHRPWEMECGVYSVQWNYFFMKTPLWHTCMPCLRPWKEHQQPLEERVKRLERSLQALLSSPPPSRKSGNQEPRQNEGVQRTDIDNIIESVSRCQLFSFITLWTVCSTRDLFEDKVKSKVRLFGYIPFLMGRGTSRKMNWRLFGLIPLMKWTCRPRH